MTWVILVVALLVVVVAFVVALLALRGQMEARTETEVLEDQVRRFWPHRGSEPNSGQR